MGNPKASEEKSSSSSSLQQDKDVNPKAYCKASGNSLSENFKDASKGFSSFSSAASSSASFSSAAEKARRLLTIRGHLVKEKQHVERKIQRIVRKLQRIDEELAELGVEPEDAGSDPEDVLELNQLIKLQAPKVLERLHEENPSLFGQKSKKRPFTFLLFEVPEDSTGKPGGPPEEEEERKAKKSFCLYEVREVSSPASATTPEKSEPKNSEPSGGEIAATTGDAPAAPPVEETVPAEPDDEDGPLTVMDFGPMKKEIQVIQEEHMLEDVLNDMEKLPPLSS